MNIDVDKDIGHGNGHGYVHEHGPRHPMDMNLGNGHVLYMGHCDSPTDD
jgi:hypothetical protein